MIRRGLAVVPLRGILGILGTLGMLALTGCGGTPGVEQVRWEIERNVPGARFEREEHFHLGRISMSLLRGLVRLTPARDEIRPLNEIRGVEVGVYQVRSLPDLDGAGQILAKFEDRLGDHGWSLMLREREADSRTWMFVRSHPDGWLRNLFIVSLEQDELTLVRVDGRLDRIFAEATANDPKRFVRDASGQSAPEPEPSATEPEAEPAAEPGYRR